MPVAKAIATAIPFIGPVKEAIETVKNLRELVERRDDSSVRGVIADLQTQLTEILQANIEMQQALRVVIQERDALRKRQDDFDRYRLVEPVPGNFVYLLREDAEDDDPPHLICAPCYADKKKALLQIWITMENPYSLDDSGSTPTGWEALCPVCQGRTRIADAPSDHWLAAFEAAKKP